MLTAYIAKKSVLQPISTTYTGDQLSVERFEGAQYALINETDTIDCFALDFGAWHVKNNYLNRMMKMFHHPDSKTEKGSYTWACYTINNVQAATFDVKKRHDTVEEMVILVTKLYTITAFKEFLRSSYPDKDLTDSKLFADEDPERVKTLIRKKYIPEFIAFILKLETAALYTLKECSHELCDFQSDSPTIMRRHFKVHHGINIEVESPNLISAYHTNFLILGLLYKLYDRSITYAHAGVKELCTIAVVHQIHGINLPKVGCNEIYKAHAKTVDLQQVLFVRSR